METQQLAQAILTGLLWIAAIYFFPYFLVRGIMTAYYEVRVKYPIVRNQNFNLQLNIPMLHVLRSFFHREGALGAEQRAEIELGARKAMLAEVGAQILDDEGKLQSNSHKNLAELGKKYGLHWEYKEEQ